MILTCPACDTKYVVKDDAIPPGGRQVRCASCKHSWHQDPEIVVAEPATAANIDFGDLPPPSPDTFEEPAAVVPQVAEVEDMVAEEPQPDVDDGGQSAWGEVAEEPVAEQPLAEQPVAERPIADDGADVAMEEAPAIADEWRAPVQAPVEQEEFVGYAPIADADDEPRRLWPLILGILILIIAAAAAFWFLAPAEWKQRAGIAQAGATQLELMITTRERQPLESGNELVVISGRIINSTNKEQIVPPIQAELLDGKVVVHRWTINPPTRVLGPGKSVNFNNAEVDEPRSGEHLLFIDWATNTR